MKTQPATFAPGDEVLVPFIVEDEDGKAIEYEYGVVERLSDSPDKVWVFVDYGFSTYRGQIEISRLRVPE